jgi:octaprenyl-diphosphate synthase
MRDYGLELGLAFQIVDDVLDYRGESGAMGKNTGDDLREGKMTLPVILTLKDANPAEREIIAGCLGKPDATEAALAQVVAIMERHGALSRSVDQARAHVERARAALETLPHGEMRKILSDIAEFYVSRAY